MDNDVALASFASDLHQEVIAAAEAEGHEALRADAFTRYMIDELIEAGELQDGEPCYHRSRGLEVSGYGFADDGETLDLFATLYRQAEPPATIGRTDIETAFRRLGGFLTRALDGYHATLEEASPIFDMALGIHQGRERLGRVRFFLFTDGLARLEFMPDIQAVGLPVSHHIWDLQRLYRYVKAGHRHEPIRIDFEAEYGMAIPCLAAPGPTPDYTAYLAILPGQVLSDLYARYGPRLLELNVRSFLQARGKVNQGLRRTIIEQPARFLAYNNGISATAHAIELTELPGGGRGIRSVTGLQIVNGGQTTASLQHAARRDRADLVGVFVQAKLTIVDNENLREIVPLISRYANTQNTVNEADFSANDPFHVRMEELSRSIWAPATGGTQRQTKWFYERARGQYQDALAREGTPARMRQFKATHPNGQRFTKTDLAKFENTWEQLPHLVSLGGQKNFREFAIRLAAHDRAEPDQVFFRRHIAKAILFRRAERVVSEEQFGGYRANIVTYTIAWLVHRTGARLDLDRIWAQQNISPALVEAIRTVAHHVHATIIAAPGGGNVTEWCKKKACWERIREIEVPLPAAFQAELGQGAQDAAGEGVGRGGPHMPEEQALIEKAGAIQAPTWIEVSSWARETGHLQAWQHGLAVSLSRLAEQGRPPSLKQAKQGLVLLERAERLGYRPAPGIAGVPILLPPERSL